MTYPMTTICPSCGNRTLESAVYADYCTTEGCDYEFYYPGPGEVVS